MSGRVLFESAWWRMIIPIMWIVIAMAFLVLIPRLFKGLYKKYRLFYRIILAINVIYSVVLMFNTTIQYGRVLSEYHNGHYETVEGNVTDFAIKTYSGKMQEGFTIDGVQFVYGGEITSPGYQRMKPYFGVVKGNGQSLRIRYISHDDKNGNVIVYIEDLKN